MDILLFYCTLTLYALATVGYVTFLAHPSRSLSRVSCFLLAGGFLVHTTSLVVRFLEAGYTPVTNRFESLTFFSWLLVAVYLGLQMRNAMPVLGAFLTPPALGLLLMAAFRSKEILPLKGLFASRWLPLHVGCSFLGDAMLGLAACLAGMYLIQERQLKNKKIGPFYYRLPSLEVLDRLSYRCIALGFPFLTLGILTGAVWLKSTHGIYIDWRDSRQTTTLLTWFLYAALLHGRLIAGWRGRRVAWMNIIGFVVILLTFLELSHFLK